MKTITKGEIIKLFMDSGYFSPEVGLPWLVIADNEFELWDERDYRLIIDRVSNANKLPYEKGVWECEDYAYALRCAFGAARAACGVLYIVPDGETTHHAIFFYINSGIELKLEEPQHDWPYAKHFAVKFLEMH